MSDFTIMHLAACTCFLMHQKQTTDIVVHARAEHAELAPFLGLRFAGRRYETTNGVLGRQITKSCSGDEGKADHCGYGYLRPTTAAPSPRCTHSFWTRVTLFFMAEIFHQIRFLFTFETTACEDWALSKLLCCSSVVTGAGRQVSPSS